jgi:NAD(P)-dependent dehydrogenase (short-subunit alcohol dehydrogenase family)
MSTSDPVSQGAARSKRLRELMSLEGRVALVTGGAGHIGAALSEALAELGAAIVVLDLHEGPCHDVAESLEQEFGVETLPLPADLESESAVRVAANAALAHFRRLDILIHCAAFVSTAPLEGWISPFAEQRADTWRRGLEVNLTAPFVLTQACAESLAESGKGSVVNVGSIYGMVGPDLRLYEGTGMGNAAAYAASKGGLLQLTRWLATALAPRVRVNAITPGGVWRQQPEDFRKRYIDRTPLGRMATEEDFKGAVAYLASDLSRYVTGQNLVVDGGWTAW